MPKSPEVLLSSLMIMTSELVPLANGLKIFLSGFSTGVTTSYIPMK